MVYNNPVVLRRRHHAGDVRRPGRRAEVRRDQGVVGERPADHRPDEPAAATATCCSAASTTWCWRACCWGRSAGCRGWSTPSRPRTGCCGTWRRPARWDEAREVYRWYTPLLHLDTHVKLVQYIKLAMAECGGRVGDGARAAAAAGGRGTRAGAEDHSAGDRHADRPGPHRPPPRFDRV